MIFCEGEVTEVEYLEALKSVPSVRDTNAVEIEIAPETGVPLTLIQHAIDAQEPNDDIDEVWCVFDVEWPDNHPGLGEVRDRAAAGNVRLAISNPCFELWLILHFQDQTAWLDNPQSRRQRRECDGTTDKHLTAETYMPLRNDARKRARLLEQKHSGDGTAFPHDNPSSGMYALLDSVDPIRPTVSSRSPHGRR